MGMLMCLAVRNLPQCSQRESGRSVKRHKEGALTRLAKRMLRQEEVEQKVQNVSCLAADNQITTRRLHSINLSLSLCLCLTGSYIVN